MRRRIELKNSTARKEICAVLGLSTGGLSLALSFERNGEKSRMARQMAMERGGILLEEVQMEGRTVRILDAKGQTVRTIKEV